MLVCNKPHKKSQPQVFDGKILSLDFLNSQFLISEMFGMSRIW